MTSLRLQDAQQERAHLSLPFSPRLLLGILAWVLLWAGVRTLAEANLDPYGDMLESWVWGQTWSWGTYKHPPLMNWVTHLWFMVWPTTTGAYKLLAYVVVAVGLLGILELARLHGLGRWLWPILVATVCGLPESTLSAKYNANTILLAAWPWVAVAWTQVYVLQATGLHGMMVLRDAGLMAGYQASGINQTLVMTGALHKGAQRRVAETTAWWLACTEDGGMAPGAEGFTMTLRVRLMHAMVRHQLCRNPQWDADELGLPVNQVDMQATYLAFSVVQLLSLKTTGVWLTARESEAVMHLWRYIGWLMGVEDGLLCDDEHTGRIMLYQNTVSQAPADETSVLLGRALMDEPLHRHYANWKTVRGRFNKARHLSLVRWFVGPEGMHALGLPTTIPWYPLAVMAPFALRTLVLHAVPGLMAPWTKWARTRQRNYLTVLMGDRGRPPHLTGSGPGSKGQAS